MRHAVPTNTEIALHTPFIPFRGNFLAANSIAAALILSLLRKFVEGRGSGCALKYEVGELGDSEHESIAIVEFWAFLTGSAEQSGLFSSYTLLTHIP